MRKLILAATYPSTFVYTWLISRLVPTALQVKANTFGITATNHPQYFQLPHGIISTPTTTIPSTFSATSPPPPANYLTNLGLGYNLNVIMNMTQFAAGALEQ
jgi:hypothetical protein